MCKRNIENIWLKYRKSFLMKLLLHIGQKRSYVSLKELSKISISKESPVFQVISPVCQYNVLVIIEIHESNVSNLSAGVNSCLVCGNRL